MTSRKEVKMFCLLLSLILTLLIFSSAEGVWYSKASSVTFLEVLENNLEISTYVHIQRSDDNGYFFTKWNDPETTFSAVHPKDSINETDACLDTYGGVVVKKVGSGDDASYYIYPHQEIYGGGIYGGITPYSGVYGAIGNYAAGYGGISPYGGGIYGGITPYGGVYGAIGNYAAGYGGGLFGELSGLFGSSASLYGTHPVDPFSAVPGRFDGGNWNSAANIYNPTLGLGSPGTSFLPNSSQSAFPFGLQSNLFLSPMASLLNGAQNGALPLLTGLNTAFPVLNTALPALNTAFPALNTALPNVLPDVIDVSAEPIREAQYFTPGSPQFSNIPTVKPPFLNRPFSW